MALVFESTVIALGDQVFYGDFSSQELSSPEWCDDLYFTGNTRRALSHQSSSLSQRLIELLAHHRSALAQISPHASVCLLLPEINDRQHIADVLKAVQRVLPSSTDIDRPLFCFPYGSASFLVALERISTLAHSSYGCWVLSLDSSESFCSGHKYQLFDDIKTDSLLVSRIVVADEGLEASKVQIDCYSQAYSSGVDSVMPSLATLCGQELTDLALSLHDDESSDWQSHLFRFSPWITQETTYRFNNLMIGEVGAGSGLLKTLGLYEQQKMAFKSTFHALQLDSDPHGMAAGVLYRWRT
ncbi:NAD/NADP transhydrogenase subunit beta [Vibrio cincinnatiensis]|uniref:NAD/NADP transhydrogenase subunit beta n=1 Tax=Vibrio cincinnatiensis TaxID=675 RepID=UPI001EE09A4F|nr:NAD/NADP transhydrogenase subunit beta [Vibrio cincinnatiensis]MCG3733386.1 NAD/NADP transhydrogenase subunit beta [Vibrio cincinnatiensis]